MVSVWDGEQSGRTSILSTCHTYMRMPFQAMTRWRQNGNLVTDKWTSFYTMTALASTSYVESTATIVRPLRTRQDVNTQTFEV